MMNISFSEIILVLLVALIVIKPEQLPEVMHAAGKIMRWIRKLFAQTKEDVVDFIDSMDKNKKT